jgi:murein DD-endopeptidase MepM/ murein hydrolase activator NlpD
MKETKQTKAAEAKAKADKAKADKAKAAQAKSGQAKADKAKADKAKADAKANGDKTKTEAKAKNEPKSSSSKAETKATASADEKRANAAPAEKSSDKLEKVAKADPQETSSVSKQEKEEATSFRWPAHGRIIAGFGSKGGNEGINIAVPEGTSVKAAEGGTVAYVGNEVRGLGNLVLISHPGGYVTAYAHLDRTSVTKGAAVRRGQAIGTVGQTGGVSQPQLHFEIRQRNKPVDPATLLR